MVYCPCGRLRIRVVTTLVARLIEIADTKHGHRLRLLPEMHVRLDLVLGSAEDETGGGEGSKAVEE